MANWSLPALTSSYTNFVTEVKDRDTDQAVGFDPAVVTPTNLPTNTIRYSSAASKWQKWNGTTWNDLAASYAIAISGNAATATLATTADELSGGAAGAVPYQTGAGATSMSAVGTAGQFFMSNAASAPTWKTLEMSDIPAAAYKKSVRAATTANITLSGTQTVDGIALAVGDRVLVKNQTTASQNGIYVVSATAWTRATDADTAAAISAALVAIDSGTANGAEAWTNTFKATDTLGTTAMNWFELVYNSGTWAISTTGSAATLTTARTLTIGATGKTFNGSANVTWTTTEIGAVGQTGATGAAVTPSGTTAQRPTPVTGHFRFNTTLGKFEGYTGAAWGAVGGGATGGGSDDVFVENSQTVTTDYTLTTGKNAMSAGPVTINSGITVTVPAGSNWAVV